MNQAILKVLINEDILKTLTRYTEKAVPFHPQYQTVDMVLMDTGYDCILN